MPIKADKSLRAYYNEIDPLAAQWIRNLMAEGWITKGDVDDRSIEDVKPNDIAGYDRLHFFAGVAVWDYALNQAGWGRGEIWTGSCPCQPFSAAGSGKGAKDERHLWPAFYELIKACRPKLVLGEQVAGAMVLGPARGQALQGLSEFGSAHAIRSAYRDEVARRLQPMPGEGRSGSLQNQRQGGFGGEEQGVSIGSQDYATRQLFGDGCECVEKTGEINDKSRTARAADAQDDGATGGAWIDLVFSDLEDSGYACAAVAFPAAGVGAPHIRDRLYWVANSNYPRLEGREAVRQRANQCATGPDGVAGGVADTASARLEEQVLLSRHGAIELQEGVLPERWAIQDTRSTGMPSPTNSFWRDADWLLCRDGKWRPVEPGTFPLAHGAPARVVRLRAYGNAINAKAAQAFIESVMEAA